MDILRTPEAWPRVLLGGAGELDGGHQLRDAEAAGAWRAWRYAVGSLGPQALSRVVGESGLRGRGGAGFPTGEKWRICGDQPSVRHYAVANGYEADPGALVDRTLMERNPHAVVEGLALAAYAVGATEAFIAVRADYTLAIERLTAAIRSAEEVGYLGTDALGAGFDLHMAVRPLQGGFVLGEETVLLRALENRRGMPEQRPPYPAMKGLWGEPTVVNNVETLAAVPWIIANGANAYRSLHGGDVTGTTLVQLSGAIARPGVAEVPLGLPLGEVLDTVGGGPRAGRVVRAVLVGGPSGGFLPVEALGTAYSYGPVESAGAIMGSGSILLADQSTCLVDLATLMTRFLADEACGKTIPCRIGTRRMMEIAERFTSGRPRPTDTQLLRDLSSDIMDGALCALEYTAPNPLLTGMRYFGPEFEDHIVRSDCPAGVCRPLRVATGSLS